MATLTAYRCKRQPGEQSDIDGENPTNPTAAGIPSVGFAIFFLKNEANHALASLAAIRDMAGRARRLQSKRQRNLKGPRTPREADVSMAQTNPGACLCGEPQPELSGPRRAAQGWTITASILRSGTVPAASQTRKIAL
jgi:hypothetical protein